MKTLRLDVDYDYDFELYGVVSSSKEHQLAWSLNKALRIRLIKQTDLSLDFLSKGRLVISNYLYRTEHSTFRMFRNKSISLSTLKMPFLMPDIKEYDYIIQISGMLSNFCEQELLSHFRLVPIVQYAKQFDPNELRYKDNLLF
jgi:hypothetical protein